MAHLEICGGEYTSDGMIPSFILNTNISGNVVFSYYNVFKRVKQQDENENDDDNDNDDDDDDDELGVLPNWSKSRSRSRSRACSMAEDQC